MYSGIRANRHVTSSTDVNEVTRIHVARKTDETDSGTRQLSKRMPLKCLDLADRHTTLDKQNILISGRNDEVAKTIWSPP